ncbi:MAG: MBL fold metallo-hydrolase, partial [Steroidobacteraceae bacterium]
AQIGELVRIARRHARAPDRHAAIKADMLELWLRLAHEHGAPLADAAITKLLQGDLDLNTQGLIVWLDRRKRPA